MSTIPQSKVNLGVFSLSWPLFLQLALTYFLGLVDIYALGHISDAAAAAVGSANTLITFILMMFSFMGQGGSLVYARFLGRGEERKAQESYLVSLVLHAVTGLLASALLFGCAHLLADAMGTAGGARAYGVTYLRIVGGGSFLFAMVTMLGGVLSANGLTRQAMYASVVTSVVNLALIYLLVLNPAGPQLGVTGVALSTVTAIAVSLLYSLWLVFFRIRIRFRRPEAPGAVRERARLLLSFTVPTMLEPALWQAAQIVTTRIIAAIGPDQLAARMYMLSITNMIGMFSSALSQGLQIAVSHRIGAGEAAQVRRTVRSTRLAGAAIALALAVAAGASGGWIMHRFTDDPDIVSTGRQLLWLSVLYLPGSSLIMNTAGALRAAGHVKYPAAVGILVLWCVFLPLAYGLSLPLGIGVTGVMFAMAVDENLRALLLHLRWRRVSADGGGHLPAGAPAEPLAAGS